MQNSENTSDQQYQQFSMQFQPQSHLQQQQVYGAAVEQLPGVLDGDKAGFNASRCVRQPQQNTLQAHEMSQRLYNRDLASHLYSEYFQQFTESFRSMVIQENSGDVYTPSHQQQYSAYCQQQPQAVSESQTNPDDPSFPPYVTPRFFNCENGSTDQVVNTTKFKRASPPPPCQPSETKPITLKDFEPDSASPSAKKAEDIVNQLNTGVPASQFQLETLQFCFNDPQAQLQLLHFLLEYGYNAIEDKTAISSLGSFINYLCSRLHGFGRNRYLTDLIREELMDLVVFTNRRISLENIQEGLKLISFLKAFAQILFFLQSELADHMLQVLHTLWSLILPSNSECSNTGDLSTLTSSGTLQAESNATAIVSTSKIETLRLDNPLHKAIFETVAVCLSKDFAIMFNCNPRNRFLLDRICFDMRELLLNQTISDRQLRQYALECVESRIKYVAIQNKKVAINPEEEDEACEAYEEFLRDSTKAVPDELDSEH